MQDTSSVSRSSTPLRRSMAIQAGPITGCSAASRCPGRRGSGCSEFSSVTENEMSDKSRRCAFQWLFGPSWRWQLGRCIARKLTTVAQCLESFPLESYDPTVQAIVALRLHKTCGTGIGHLNPDWILALRHAYSAYRDPTRRLTIEAFVLAGEGAAEIGKRVGLPSRSLAEFKRTFFDVRGSLRQGISYLTGLLKGGPISTCSNNNCFVTPILAESPRPSIG